MKVVAYYRVSTSKQERSGLGLEAQQAYVRQAAEQMGWEVVESYTDVVSGKVDPGQRPECSKALTACKALGAVLVVAKLDRLSRTVSHISRLMETTAFKVATMPEADSFQLHIYAALAEQERKFISQRTREGLQALKARAAQGDVESVAKLNKQVEARRKTALQNTIAVATQAVVDKADKVSQSYADAIKSAMFDGVSTLSALAERFNTLKLPSSRGVVGNWQAVQVDRLCKRLGIAFP